MAIIAYMSSQHIPLSVPSETMSKIIMERGDATQTPHKCNLFAMPSAKMLPHGWPFCFSVCSRLNRKDRYRVASSCGIWCWYQKQGHRFNVKTLSCKCGQLHVPSLSISMVTDYHPRAPFQCQDGIYLILPLWVIPC